MGHAGTRFCEKCGDYRELKGEGMIVGGGEGLFRCRIWRGDGDWDGDEIKGGQEM